jgi:uncharacterized protein (TIGR02453 family)
MSLFRGFADDDARFFKKLAKNMSREWFHDHKEEYEQGWAAPMKALLEEVRSAIDASYERVDLGAPKVFRINRDVRFSKDKTPYKTTVSGVLAVARAAKATEAPAALYVQVGTEIICASGLYAMDATALERYRAAVADDRRGVELTRILARLARAGFDLEHMGEGSLKRVPKGFDPEHPRAELLKRKGLGVLYPALPKELLTSPKLVKWLLEPVKKTVPLVEWLTMATA